MGAAYFGIEFLNGKKEALKKSDSDQRGSNYQPWISNPTGSLFVVSIVLGCTPPPTGLLSITCSDYS